MKFLILLIILFVQVALFFLGGIFNKEISKKLKKFGRTLKFLYTIDSLVIIGYLIYYIVYIFNSGTGIYSISGNRIFLTVVFSIIILANVFKLYVLLVVRGREHDGFSVLMGLSKNINNTFQNVLGGIYTALFALTICGVIFAILSIDYTTEPQDGHMLMESVPFKTLNFKKIKKSEDSEQYTMCIIKEDGEEYPLELDSKDTNLSKVESSNNKYVEKYQIKENTENLLFTREKVHYEYIIYTNDENEKEIAEYYVD